MTERPFSLFFWPALGALVERGLATQRRGDRGRSEGDFICCTALGTNRRHLASRALYNVRLRESHSIYSARLLLSTSSASHTDRRRVKLHLSCALP